MTEPPVLGTPFVCVETDAAEYLSARGHAAGGVRGNEPPWSAVRPTLVGSACSPRSTRGTWTSLTCRPPSTV